MLGVGDMGKFAYKSSQRELFEEVPETLGDLSSEMELSELCTAQLGQASVHQLWGCPDTPS